VAPRGFVLAHAMHTILLMLSGGVDSARMLHHYLAETDLPVHAHHVSIMNRIENRWRQELLAVQRIVQHCQARYRPFGFSRSACDFTALPRYIGWDSDLVFLAATRVAVNLPGERIRVAVGWSADDLKRAVVRERMERGVPHRVWEALRDSVDHAGRLDHELDLPLLDLSKAEIVRRTPGELLDLAWVCRRPLVESGQARPCGICHACRLFAESRASVSAPGAG